MDILKSVGKKGSKAYYFDRIKFIRDLVHGYVYLTEFELELIDTLQFQRLKDIRQLTCQHIFPAARHTRFEHSLGVMELTRQAIKNLNQNGLVANCMDEKSNLLDEQLQFNAVLAALLHDVGHCPFSHLGEKEFNETEVWARLYESAKNCPDLQGSTLLENFDRINSSGEKYPGAKHEQLSCIMILEKFSEILSKVKEYQISIDESGENFLSVDYELLIRSILGIEYPTALFMEFQMNKEKNVVVQLINSRVFDMDKLDYIMRDSLFTGIGTPQIDTHRLFRNMYLNSEYKLVFTNRAVPALQNMIEARDGLYMYVYNHHTAVFSDFMNSYIFRRLARNGQNLLRLAGRFADGENAQRVARGQDPVIHPEELEVLLNATNDYATNLGIVSSDYLFSPDAVLEQNRSDSDLISLLNILHYALSRTVFPDDLCGAEKSLLEMNVLEEVEEQLFPIKGEIDFDQLKEDADIKAEISRLTNNVRRVYHLIDNYQRREYLKPWWKTNFEFTNFIETNFRDDRVRQQLCAWVCQGNGDRLAADEFRSQLAKNVIYITQRLWEDRQKNGLASGLLAPLEDREFFVIERSARFFETEAIGELDIALKSNEILGSPGDIKYLTGGYYVKSLANVIPQKDYYSMYAKNSFYIFSKKILDEARTAEELSRHYCLIEQIFVFVATSLINEGIRKFQENYGKEEPRRMEEEAHKCMYENFRKSFFQVKV